MNSVTFAGLGITDGSGADGGGICVHQRQHDPADDQRGRGFSAITPWAPWAVSDQTAITRRSRTARSTRTPRRGSEGSSESRRHDHHRQHDQREYRHVASQRGTRGHRCHPTSILINSTVSGNSSTLDAGGIFIDGDLDAVSSTIASNTADSDDAGGGNGGGVYINFGSASMANTIIADNIDESDPVFADCFGIPGSDGTTCSRESAARFPPDIIGVDPLLAALAPNGGPTQTRALMPGSPAINAGNAATPGGLGACPATDQRGLPRGGAAGRCDIGAFEVQPAPPVTPPSSSAPPAKKKCKKGRKLKKGKCVKKKRRRSSPTPPLNPRLQAREQAKRTIA